MDRKKFKKMDRSTEHLKTVYLAGPDVFRPNANQHFANMSKVLNLHGFKAITPLDSNAKFHHGIFGSNVHKIWNCDYLLANLDPIRGSSADAGTCVEIGMAYALDKKIIGYYTNGIPHEYKKRVKSNYLVSKYTMVEDFGLTDNLMLINSCNSICHNFYSAVKLIWILENGVGSENRNFI